MDDPDDDEPATPDARGGATFGPGDTPLTEVVQTIDEHRGAAPADGRGDGGGQFAAVDGARIRCLTCRSEFDAATISADRATRLEGASDPADMSFVVPLTCPVCATAGSLVLRYGPEADRSDSEVLAALERVPHVGAVGDEPTPGIR